MPKSSIICYQKILLVFILVMSHSLLKANISMSDVFADGMVLQQKAEITLWGWGKPGEKIQVIVPWLDSTRTTTASNQGTWSVALLTPEAGKPFDLTIKGYNEVVFHNVVLGEVWLCAGQSNMEWTPRMGINDAEEAIAAANYPDIRFFRVHHRTAMAPQEDLGGEWVSCTPETMKNSSAIAYFFAQKLHQEIKVPIGLIDASWGGTPVEIWMAAKVIESDEVFAKSAATLKPVPWGPVEPGRAYNAMIAPLTRYRIAGAIWYQGESNVGNAITYKDMFTAMISSWRQERGYDFPFYFAQIAPYKYGEGFGGAMLRDAQRKSLELHGTGMVVTSDIGNIEDIHPRNKKDVGLRFALLALTSHYKVLKAESSGPLYRGYSTLQNKITVYFDHAEGLNARGGKPTHFEIAGEDQVFRPAEAEIKGQNIVLSSKEVKSPVAVRFGWSNTAEPNLFNAAGLPASCFHSEPHQLLKNERMD
ncbi:MAG: sialate O-acetylesterase [Bacteroidia bacterium]|nr:sialate O-acetylesterase [Bacteroidia bacterium]